MGLDVNAEGLAETESLVKDAGGTLQARTCDVSQRAGQDVSQVQLDSAVAMWSDVDIADQPGGENGDEK